MDESLVVLDGVVKRFGAGGPPALAGVSGGIGRGRITGLVGPDGAGKTTLMRLMAGLLAPSEGAVRFDGRDPASHAPEIRSAIGYMPQKFGLYEDLSVRENLELYADLRSLAPGERKPAFRRLLDFTGLEPFQRRFAGKLSGGMKQKLGLACSLLGQPRLLLLDEPSVGVDPISRRELWTMVHALVDSGLTVVWSTSYLDEAELCSQVFLLNEGRALFAGAPRELTARVAGRCFQLREPGPGHRRILGRAQVRPEVLDGVIQGRSLRLLLRPGAGPFAPAEIGAGPEARFVPVPARFEDGFIDILGGVPGGESALAAQLAPRGLDGATVVEAEELTKHFGNFVAADRVTFAVRRGEIYGLLGPNGAGKSTTFKMLCGLLAPTSGSARVMGLDLRRRGGAARQRLGYMAQKFSLYGDLTVGQNLVFFAGIYGLGAGFGHQAVERMIGVFGLGPHLNEPAERLPLGFKQRLALACAVMHEPDILFLDEPTSGVDPVTRREFWGHINGVVEKGITVVVTTHFMDEAEYCDRIGIVFRGQLIASGTPDEVRRGAATAERLEPTLEEAFIARVLEHRDAA